MAWCHQPKIHYLSHCWPILLSPYGVTGPHWVKYDVTGVASLWWFSRPTLSLIQRKLYKTNAGFGVLSKLLIFPDKVQNMIFVKTKLGKWWNFNVLVSKGYISLYMYLWFLRKLNKVANPFIVGLLYECRICSYDYACRCPRTKWCWAISSKHADCKYMQAIFKASLTIKTFEFVFAEQPILLKKAGDMPRNLVEP